MARPIELAEIEAAANGDLPNVHLFNPNNLALARWLARLLVERLESDGKSRLDPPWPPGDRTDDLKGVWDGWSIEALLERGRQVSLAALDAYRALVDRWFPTFAGQLRLASAWPVRLVSTVGHDAETGWPRVTWRFEPLPLGSDVEVVWRQARAQGDPFPGNTRETILSQRPDLEGRYHASITEGHLDLFEMDPATGLAYGWLWDDLREWSWTCGARTRPASGDWVALSCQAVQVLVGLMKPSP